MRIASIPDTHFPFHNTNALDCAIEIIRSFRPDVVIQLGDLYDLFSFSKYPRDPSLICMTAEAEVSSASAAADKMWSDVRRACKRARLVQLTDANHDTRIIKRLMEKAPDSAFIAADFVRRMFDFSKYNVERAESGIIIDGILFEHGCRKPGHHARFNQMNTVTGHTHKARIEYFSNVHGPYWEFNCGWLGDVNAPVFSYRSSKAIDDTHIGVGLIENGQPRFFAIQK